MDFFSKKVWTIKKYELDAEIMYIFKILHTINVSITIFMIMLSHCDML